MTNALPTIYPAAISRAICALDELPEFREMPEGFMRILVRIIKKIDLRKPESHIFASRSTLAAESGKSLEVVHRCVRWLVEQGFLSREQKQIEGRRGSRSPLSPTAKLLDVLMLSKEKRAQVEEAKKASHPAPGANGFERVNGATLPADLAWLVKTGGMKATGVLQLMAMAKAAQLTLTQIVESAKDYLKPHKGSALYGYLRRLVSKGPQESVRKAAETKRQKAAAVRAQAARDQAEKMEGHLYRDTLTQAQVRVHPGAEIEVRERDGTLRRGPVTPSFLEAIEAGRLVRQPG